NTAGAVDFNRVAVEDTVPEAFPGDAVLQFATMIVDRSLYSRSPCWGIKCGYPNSVLGNFLTKNYNYITSSSSKGFRWSVPLTESCGR
ncbi:unnamed protein product, partial [Arctogadus glacialis]